MRLNFYPTFYIRKFLTQFSILKLKVLLFKVCLLEKIFYIKITL